MASSRRKESHGVEMFHKLLDEGVGEDNAACCCAGGKDGSGAGEVRPSGVDQAHTKFKASLHPVEGREGGHAVLKAGRQSTSGDGRDGI